MGSYDAFFGSLDLGSRRFLRCVARGKCGSFSRLFLLPSSDRILPRALINDEICRSSGAFMAISSHAKMKGAGNGGRGRPGCRQNTPPKALAERTRTVNVNLSQPFGSFNPNFPCSASRLYFIVGKNALR